MKPLLQILLLWRSRWGWLLFGAAVALASGLSGVALLALAGTHVAILLLGAGAAAAGLLTVLGPVRVVLRYFERLLTHNATFRALADLRVWLFRRLAARSAGGLGMDRSGDLMARLVSDVEALDGLYLRILIPLLLAVALVPVLLVLLVVEAGPLWDEGLACVILFALAAFVVPALCARVATGSGGKLAEAGAALRVAVLDTLSGIREVRVFGAEQRMLDTVRARNQAVGLAQRILVRRAAAVQAAGFILAQCAIFLMLLQAHERPVFAAGAIFLLVAAFEVAGGLPRAGALAGNAAASARRVLDAARPGSAIADPVHPATLPASTAIRIEGVHFRWEQGRPEVFDGLTMEIASGARIAILGPSGSGKSTLTALLLKIAAPQSGRITLGDVDVARLTAAELRSRFAVLSQATHLFDDTIRANLLLGRPGADETELWRALDEAEVGEFVRSLPDRLDTWLGEGGARVSGGQGRRIALARALLSPAPVLILDEPAAGLDALTERAFLKTLGTLPPGRTVILITHRLTGVETLDRIWRLSGGHAVAAAA